MIKSIYSKCVTADRCRWLIKNTANVYLACILTSIAIYILYILFSSTKHNLSVTMPITVSLIGLFFVALKYKLDKLSYHKDLFNKRFEIFLVVNSVLWEWASPLRRENNRVSDEMIKKLSDELAWKSYYLFSGVTRDFIRSIRENLITYKTYQASDHGDFNSKDRIKFQEAETFLRPLFDNDSLAEKFPELQIINNYC